MLYGCGHDIILCRIDVIRIFCCKPAILIIMRAICGGGGGGAGAEGRGLLARKVKLISMREVAASGAA